MHPSFTHSPFRGDGAAVGAAAGEEEEAAARRRRSRSCRTFTMLAIRTDSGNVFGKDTAARDLHGPDFCRALQAISG